MSEAYFVIPGRPQGKARPRVVRNSYTGKTVTYTPKNTRDYETLVKACFLEQCGNKKFSGAVSMEIEAVFAIPKNVSKKKRAEMDGQYYTCKCDADNVAKGVSDALNGLAYPDDSAIARLVVEKKYGEEACVKVKIAELETAEKIVEEG